MCGARAALFVLGLFWAGACWGAGAGAGCFCGVPGVVVLSGGCFGRGGVGGLLGKLGSSGWGNGNKGRNRTSREMFLFVGSIQG